jgi:hypothetical protein
MIHLSIRRVVRATWRIAAATMAMGFGVRYVESLWPLGQGVPTMLLQLATFAGAGAAVYAACLLGLWRLQGAPDGPERHAVKAIRALIARVDPAQRAPAAPAKRAAG